MLETFVPSRTRRVLLEHLLTHPDERFYLRGLAKTLELPVTPLRRELKRLEQLGALRATQEGNMLFYEADLRAAPFATLSPRGPVPASAGSHDPAPSARSAPANGPIVGPAPGAGASPPARHPADVAPVTVSPGELRKTVRHEVRERLQIAHLERAVNPVQAQRVKLAAASAAAIVLLGVLWSTATTRRAAPMVGLLEPSQEAVWLQENETSFNDQESAITGEMRSTHWRLTPAAMEHVDPLDILNGRSVGLRTPDDNWRGG